MLYSLIQDVKILFLLINLQLYVNVFLNYVICDFGRSNIISCVKVDSALTDDIWIRFFVQSLLITSAIIIQMRKIFSLVCNVIQNLLRSERIVPSLIAKLKTLCFV